jgi:hypothetical protein
MPVQNPVRVPASQVYKVTPVKGVTFRKQVKVRQIVLQSIDINHCCNYQRLCRSINLTSMTAPC